MRTSPMRFPTISLAGLSFWRAVNLGGKKERKQDLKDKHQINYGLYRLYK
jgi:hypothetical protein